MKVEVEQNTETWFALRRGRITASNADVLYIEKSNSETYKNYAFKVAYERVFDEEFPDNFNGNAYTDAGSEREIYAKELYEKEQFRKVHEPGFFYIDDFVGASPDGILEPDGLIEVKSIISGKQYRKRIENNFEPDKSHYYQCLFQMYVTGRIWVDLVFYPPTPKANIVIRRIERNENEIEDLQQRIELFKSNVQEQIDLLTNHKNKNV